MVAFFDLGTIVLHANGQLSEVVPIPLIKLVMFLVYSSLTLLIIVGLIWLVCSFLISKEPE
jgi:hypothetical protein